MEPIIFSTFNNSITNLNNTVTNRKIPDIPNDSIELSSKKKTEAANNKKKILLIAGGAALAVGGCIAIIKLRNLSKAKKEITALYNNIFDDMKNKIKGDINFEKPELVFKRLKKGLGGGYIPGRNQIEIDPRRLRQTCILKDLKSVTTSEIASGLELADGEIKTNFLQLIRKGLGGQYRMANKKEALAITGATLSHELTHAKQFQLLLSTEGGLEKYITALKSKPGITEEILRKEAPFIFKYKPQKILPNNIAITEGLTGGKKLKYGVNNVLEAFTKYVEPGENRLGYYTNLAEISARNGEAKYWEKLANGTFSRDGISDDLIKHFQTSSTYNTEVLTRIVAKK